MVYSYVIDKNIIDNPSDDELNLWLERFDSFLTTISKKSIWVDCNELGMSNYLMIEFGKYINKTASKNQFLSSKLTEFYTYHIQNCCIGIQNSCLCKNSNNCTPQDNINSIKKIHSNLPHFIITHDPAPYSIEKVNINMFKQSACYLECIKNTSWEGGLSSDINVMTTAMSNGWGHLIKICSKEIKILDRNIFSGWLPKYIQPDNLNNYKNALLQYQGSIYKNNPSIKLSIVTRYKKYPEQKVYNKTFFPTDAISDMQRFINENNTIKTEIIFCDEKTSIDHDRFILFDEIIGAELNRGLDTFVPNKSFDKFRVIYYHVDEIIRYFSNAIKVSNRNTDPSIIKNY